MHHKLPGEYYTNLFLVQNAVLILIYILVWCDNVRAMRFLVAHLVKFWSVQDALGVNYTNIYRMWNALTILDDNHAPLFGVSKDNYFGGKVLSRKYSSLGVS
jgi:hypothetical protein